MAAGWNSRVAAAVGPDQRRPSANESRRSLSTIRRNDVLAIAGSAIAALSLTSLLFFRLLPFSGVLGFVFVAYVLFLAIYALILSIDDGRSGGS